MLQGIGKPMVIMPVSIYRQVLAPVIVLPILAWMTLDIISLWIAIDMFIFSSALFLWWYGEKKMLKL
jgi:Na+-driven multidrug efflux pump